MGFIPSQLRFYPFSQNKDIGYNFPIYIKKSLLFN